ncbi:MAG: HlyD family secretion protein [Candidatus Brocadiia bacterium]
MSSINGNKKKWIYGCGAGVLLIGILVSGYVVRGLGRIVTNDAYIEGRIHSISSKIPGTIKAVCAEDNKMVRKGDLLVEIDATDYEIAANLARANLDVQEALFEQAKRDKEREESLYKDKVSSKSQYEKKLTAYSLAAAQLKAAGEQYKIAQRNLEHTRILAPSDGYVTKKSAVAGNQIMPVQPLMAIVALDDIWLVANYKETQLKKFRIGQCVEIKVDSYPGKVFTGKVDSIMAGTGAAFSLFPPENALGNYVKVVQRIPVKIVFDKDTDTEHVLRLGMSCEPTIQTRE